MPRSLGDTRRSSGDRRAASPPWESTTCGSASSRSYAPTSSRRTRSPLAPTASCGGEDHLASPRLTVTTCTAGERVCRRGPAPSPSPRRDPAQGSPPRTCPPRAAIGHPAVIEAGVCLGGRDAKPGITVYRFANRTPPPARRGLLRTAAPHTLWRGQASPSSSRAAVTSPPSSARSGSRGQTTRSDTRRTPTADRRDSLPSPLPTLVEASVFMSAGQDRRLRQSREH